MLILTMDEKALVDMNYVVKTVVDKNIVNDTHCIYASMKNSEVIKFGEYLEESNAILVLREMADALELGDTIFRVPEVK